MKTLIFTLFFCGFLVTGILSANNPTTENEATTLARNFYFEIINQFNGIGFDEIVIDEVRLFSRDHHDFYYVVNLHKGFVLISAPKNTSKPMLTLKTFLVAKAHRLHCLEAFQATRYQIR